MSEHVNKSAGLPGGDATAGCDSRKHYKKPSFRSEKIFETMALQCGKMAPTGGACNLVKMAS